MWMLTKKYNRNIVKFNGQEWNKGVNVPNGLHNMSHYLCQEKKLSVGFDKVKSKNGFKTVYNLRFKHKSPNYKKQKANSTGLVALSVEKLTKGVHRAAKSIQAQNHISKGWKSIQLKRLFRLHQSLRPILKKNDGPKKRTK